MTTPTPTAPVEAPTAPAEGPTTRTGTRIPDAFFDESSSHEETVLRVSGGADVKQLAASISWALSDSKRVVLRAVGAGAVSQAVKAAAIARQYVAIRARDLILTPGFQDVFLPDTNNPGEKKQITAVILVVSTR